MKNQKTYKYIIFINKSNLQKKYKTILMQENIENKLCFKNTTNYIKSLKNGAGEAIQTFGGHWKSMGAKAYK